MQQHHGERGGKKRLEVRRERRPRRTDPVERPEPELVRQDERPERREHEERPHLPAETPVLAANLRHGRQRDSHPRRAEHDRADPPRRIAAHQRRHQHRVAGPGRGGEKAEEHAADVAGDLAPRPEGDERHAREREHGARPESRRERLRPEGDAPRARRRWASRRGSARARRPTTARARTRSRSG